MMPVGPLMIEHRLIERMIMLLDRHVRTVPSPTLIDLSLIENGVDFLCSYADRCHHGKEEDYLFLALSKKALSVEFKAILEQLIEEHAAARAAVKSLAEARARALQGDASGYQEITAIIAKLMVLYPAHIEKEDKHFFVPVMEYFTQEEQEVMLQQFAEFDQGLIHEKYRSLVENLESSPQEIETSPWQVSSDLSVYECTVCGYIYDPKLGDLDHGVAAGTAFSELPADWVCPLCGSGKEMFEKVSE